MNIKINLPFIMYFDDYHAIFEFAARFNEMRKGQPKLKYTEIMNESDYGYKALFYIGKQDQKYKKILKAYNDAVKQEYQKYENELK